MKLNTIIIVVLGLIVVGAAVLALQHLSSSEQSSTGGNSGGNSQTTASLPTRTDVLAQFSAVGEKIRASGLSYGGNAMQLIEGDETAMVYIYKPPGESDVSSLLASGFSALYPVFTTKDPLLVGIVDTTQKLNSQQFKVDIYALERAVVQEYLNGNTTSAELARNALLVTPDTPSLHANGSSYVKKSIDLNYNRPGNFTPPANRTISFGDYLEENGYSRPMGLQAGPLSDGEKAVSVVMPINANATDADKYGEIDAILRACASSYGDFDRYMISLMPSGEGVNDYYYMDASALPVLAYLNGDINQYQLYNDVNMTYYTK